MKTTERNTERMTARIGTRTSRSCRHPMVLAAGALALAMAPLSASAADWNLDANGNWNVNTNWLPNTSFPNAADAVADFSKLNITDNRTVTLGANIKVGSIILGDTDSTHRYTIGANNASHTLTM